MKNTTLLFIYLLLHFSLYAQIVPNLDPPTPKPIKPASVPHTQPVKPALPITESGANKLVLKVKTKVDCTLIVDGENKGILKADEMKKLYLPKGEFDLVAKPLQDNAYENYNAVIKVMPDDLNSERVYEIIFKAIGRGLNQDETINWIVNTINGAVSKGPYEKSYWGDGSQSKEFLGGANVEYDNNQKQFTFNFVLEVKSMWISKWTFRPGDTTISFTSFIQLKDFDRTSFIAPHKESPEELNNNFLLPTIRIEANCKCISGMQDMSNSLAFYINSNYTSVFAAKLNKAIHHLKELEGLERYDKSNEDFNK